MIYCKYMVIYKLERDLGHRSNVFLWDFFANHKIDKAKK